MIMINMTGSTIGKILQTRRKKRTLIRRGKVENSVMAVYVGVYQMTSHRVNNQKLFG